MNWEYVLLQVLKYLVIIILVVGFFLIWTSVPDYQLKEAEAKHAPKQSK